MSDLQKCLLDILLKHRGIKNRITREDLRAKASAELGLWVENREMRRAIEELRTLHPQGAWICAANGFAVDGGGTRGVEGGYFMATTSHELEIYLEQDAYHARQTLRRLTKQKHRAGVRLSESETLIMREVEA